MGFKVGDRVHHKLMYEDGTVISADKDVVRVEFDRRSARGNAIIGEYDEVWFNTHPDTLCPLSNGERA